MQNKFWLFLSVLLLSVAITTTSCDPDETDPTPNDTPPLISLSANPPSDAALGSQMSVSISVEKGDNPLKTITIQEDGTNIDLSRVDLAGVGANPLLVAGDDVNGLNWDLLITASNQCGSFNYTIIATDDAGLTNETSFLVSIESEFSPSVAFNVTPPVGVGMINQVIDIDINGTVGELPLTSVTILADDGFPVDASRVEYNGVSENPVFLTGDDVNGLNGIIKFTTQDMEDTRTFSVELADECSLTSSVSFEVTVNTGTPIAMELTGVLLNQAGPVGTGALDLDTGLSSGVTSTNPDNGTTPDMAEIRDMGIDNGPVATNWLGQMGPMTANGAEMRKVDLTVVENFDFDNITTTEQIAGAYDSGLLLLETVDGNIATAAVVAGDLFIVQRDGTNYLIRVDVVTETPDNNADSYELSIKF